MHLASLDVFFLRNEKFLKVSKNRCFVNFYGIYGKLHQNLKIENFINKIAYFEVKGIDF